MLSSQKDCAQKGKESMRTFQTEEEGFSWMDVEVRTNMTKASIRNGCKFIVVSY